jgi:DNA-binding transcriptional LysR family regulator
VGRGDFISAAGFALGYTQQPDRLQHRRGNRAAAGLGRERGTARPRPAASPTERAIYAVYPSARFIPAKVRAFVEFVAARLRGSGEN